MKNDNHNPSIGHNLLNPIRELIVAARGQVLRAIRSCSGAGAAGYQWQYGTDLLEYRPFNC